MIRHSSKKSLWEYIFFFRDWKVFEKSLLLVTSLVITIFYVLDLTIPSKFSAFYSTEYGHHATIRVLLDTTAFMAGIVNTICLILLTKKRIINYVYGILAVILLGIIAIVQHNTGNWILCLVIELPMNFIGIFLWRKNSIDKVSIKSRDLNWIKKIVVFIIISIATTSFYFLFKYEPFRAIWYKSNPEYHSEWYYVLVDSLGLVIGITAMFLAILRYRDNWYLWLVCDITFVVLFIVEQNWSLMATWIAGAVNAIYGIINWKNKTSKR